MKFTRGEKITLLVFLASVSVAIAAYFALSQINTFNESRYQDNLRRSTELVGLGEVARLDNELAKKGSQGESGFDGSYQWSGELDVSVESAVLYNSGDEARKHIDLDLRFPDWGRRIHKNVLVCRVKITNKSAESQIKSKSGHRWLNINDVFFSGSKRIEGISYFDGMPEEGSADEGENVYFDLKKGESRLYTVAFVVGRGSDAAAYQLESGVEDGVPRYVFELNKEKRVE